MMLKYESEILFDLMKRDGDDTPSDVLPYKSELIEKYLEQVEGSYPKLQDYRSEWLYYNLLAHIPAEFPLEVLSNVTEATVDNVVPYAYRSAILKGQTLVNLIKGGDVKKEITYSGGTEARYYFNKSMLKANVDYLLIYEVIDFSGDDSNISFNGNNGDGITQSYFNKNGIHKTKVNFSDVGAIKDFIIFYKITGSSLGGFINNVMLIEYQEGMENWDIPYFEGMQSVKMPVLTTSNEDGTKTNILTVNEPVELRGIGDVKDELDCLTGEVTERIGEIVLDGSEDWSDYPTPSGGDDYISFLINTPKLSNRKVGYTNTLCDGMKIGTSTTVIDEFIEPHPSNPSMNEWVVIRILKSRLETANVSGLKKWLSNNPLTLQYELIEKPIKTVNLTVTDQDGNSNPVIRPIEGTMHLMTEGESIKPLFSGEIPVEAITQNLASFIKE